MARDDVSGKELATLLAGVPLGIVSSWGHPLGRDHVTARMAEHLVAAGAQVHGLLDGELGHEPIPELAGLDELPRDPGEFASWIERHDVRGVIFNEFPDGETPECALPRVAAESGAAPFMYLAWERAPEQVLESLRGFRAVISPHTAFSRKLEAADVPSLRLRWGWRLPHPKPPLSAEEPILLLHISGTGGEFRRKASDTVAAAFLRLAEDSRFQCRITTQRHFEPELSATLEDAGVIVDEGNLPAARIEALNRGARVAVLPSRWEGIGLPILEALAAGTPVVTSDGAPMNEWVRHRREGLLVPGQAGSQEGIAVETREVSVDDLVDALRELGDRELLARLEAKAMAGGPGRVDPGDAARQFASAIGKWLDHGNG